MSPGWNNAKRGEGARVGVCEVVGDIDVRLTRRACEPIDSGLNVAADEGSGNKRRGSVVAVEIVEGM